MYFLQVRSFKAFERGKHKLLSSELLKSKVVHAKCWFSNNKL